MATPNAHTEASGAPHKEQFPPFDTSNYPSQLVWVTIAFVLLYLMTAKLVLPRVGGIIEARRERIAGDIEEAQRLKSDSDAALAAYEKSLVEARGRAQAVANQRRERQNAEAETTRRSLEQSLHAKLAEAEKSIAAAQAAAMTHVREIAADAAGAIVARLSGIASSTEAIQSAVGDVLKR